MNQATVHLDQAFARLDEWWSPKVVASVNDQYVKITRVQGEFPWHSHEHEDELFLVVRGRLSILRAAEDGGNLSLGPGELAVVARGTRHATAAEEETWVVLVEPKTTAHAGTADTPMARSIEQQLT